MKTRQLFLTVMALLIPALTIGRELPSWLNRAVFYHIYPSTFRDSNADGVGDLKGIEQKLDYVHSIGATAVWIGPVFCSEFQDGGYDITDYYTIDPRFGTNADAESLIAKAHKEGLKVCFDLVAGHTSIKHPWFEASRRAEQNKYSDYYIWTESADVKPNKNFIISDAPRGGNYMKNFFDCQPALNYGYHNPDPTHSWEQGVDQPGPVAVKQELKNIISYWMDKGVDGFRVDMAQSLIKNDPQYEAMMAFWGEMREWFSGKYPEGVLISEWSVPHCSVVGGFHIDLMIHNKQGGKIYRPMVCNTSDKGDPTDCYFDLEGKGQIADAIKVYTQEYEAVRGYGYASMPTSSHDIWRLNRNQRSTPQELKVAMTYFLTQPAPPIIYYGEEIGMRNQEQAPSKEGSYTSRNRSSCRTPMQWDSSANAGFSSAEADMIYLPIDSDPERPTVEKQRKDKNSLLNYVKKILKLRASSAALSADGMWRMVSDPEHPYPMVYMRWAGEEQYLIILNPSNRTVGTTFPSIGGELNAVVGDRNAIRFVGGPLTDKLEVSPVTALICKVKPAKNF